MAFATALVAGPMAIAVGAPPAASVASATGTVTYAIPGDQVFPEGVASAPGGGAFYVSSTTDGTIYRGLPGRPSLEVFLPPGGDGRTIAVGLKVDRAGRLYVSGGGTGQMWVYDTRTRALIRHFDTGLRGGSTFINDVALDRAGNAYFTDSVTPVLWRVPAGAVRAGLGTGQAERFVDFTGTVLRYQPGFNLNGIAPVDGGRRLITVQSNTGKLFRIGITGKRVSEVSVDGDLTTGDGLLAIGTRLLVVRHLATADQRFEGIVTVAVQGLSGHVVSTYTDPTFRWPTTVARARDRLLVVNSQFDVRGVAPPSLPFTLSGVPIAGVAG